MFVCIAKPSCSTPRGLAAFTRCKYVLFFGSELLRHPEGLSFSRSEFSRHPEGLGFSDLGSKFSRLEFSGHPTRARCFERNLFFQDSVLHNNLQFYFSHYPFHNLPDC